MTQLDSPKKERVLYLDLDDAVLVWTPDGMGFAAPKADEFLKWALEHFEVRWLTMWCPSGRLRKEGAEELSYRFGYTIEPEIFFNIANPKKFIMNKTDGIDLHDERPWVWVDDHLSSNDRWVLQSLGLVDNWYRTNCTENVVALQATWRKLSKEFNLPGPPLAYTKKVIKPPIILSNDEMLNKYRHGKMQNHDAERPPEVTQIWLP